MKELTLTPITKQPTPSTEIFFDFAHLILESMQEPGLPGCKNIKENSGGHYLFLQKLSRSIVNESGEQIPSENLKNSNYFRIGPIDLSQKSEQEKTLYIYAFISFMARAITHEGRIVDTSLTHTNTPEDCFFIQFTKLGNIDDNHDSKAQNCVETYAEKRWGELQSSNIDPNNLLTEIYKIRQTLLSQYGLNTAIKDMGMSNDLERSELIMLLGGLYYKCAQALSHEFTNNQNSINLIKLMYTMGAQFILFGLCLSTTPIPQEQQEKKRNCLKECLLNLGESHLQYLATTLFSEWPKAWPTMYSFFIDPLINKPKSKRKKTKEDPISGDFLVLNEQKIFLEKLIEQISNDDRFGEQHAFFSEKISEIKELQSKIAQNYPLTPNNPNTWLTHFIRKEGGLLVETRITLATHFLENAELLNHETSEFHDSFKQSIKLLQDELTIKEIKKQTYGSYDLDQLTSLACNLDQLICLWCAFLSLSEDVHRINKPNVLADKSSNTLLVVDGSRKVFLLKAAAQLAKKHQRSFPESIIAFLKGSWKAKLELDTPLCIEVIIHSLIFPLKDKDDVFLANIVNILLEHISCCLDGNFDILMTAFEQELRTLKSTPSHLLETLFCKLEKAPLSFKQQLCHKVLYPNQPLPIEILAKLPMGSIDSSLFIHKENAVKTYQIALANGFVSMNDLPNVLKKIKEILYWSFETLAFLKELINTNISPGILIELFCELCPSFEALNPNLQAEYQKFIRTYLTSLKENGLDEAIVRAEETLKNLKWEWEIIIPLSIEKRIDAIRNAPLNNFDLDAYRHLFNELINQPNSTENQEIAFHAFLEILKQEAGNARENQQKALAITLEKERAEVILTLVSKKNGGNLLSEFKAINVSLLDQAGKDLWEKLAKKHIKQNIDEIKKVQENRMDFQEIEMTGISGLDSEKIKDFQETQISNIYNKWFKLFCQKAEAENLIENPSHITTTHLISDLVCTLAVRNEWGIINKTFTQIPKSICGNLAKRLLTLRKKEIEKELEPIILSCHLNYLEFILEDNEKHDSKIKIEHIKTALSTLATLYLQGNHLHLNDDYNCKLAQLANNKELLNSLASSLVDENIGSHILAEQKIKLLYDLAKLENKNLTNEKRIALYFKALPLSLANPNLPHLEDTSAFALFNALLNLHLKDISEQNHAQQNKKISGALKAIGHIQIHLSLLMKWLVKWAETQPDIFTRLWACEIYQNVCLNKKWYTIQTPENNFFSSNPIITLLTPPSEKDMPSNWEAIEPQWQVIAFNLLVFQLNQLMTPKSDVQNKDQLTTDYNNEILKTFLALTKHLKNPSIYDEKFSNLEKVENLRKIIPICLNLCIQPSLSVQEKNNVMSELFEQLYKETAPGSQSFHLIPQNRQLLFEFFQPQTLPPLTTFLELSENIRKTFIEFCVRYAFNAEISNTLFKKFIQEAPQLGGHVNFLISKFAELQNKTYLYTIIEFIFPIPNTSFEENPSEREKQLIFFKNCISKLRTETISQTFYEKLSSASLKGRVVSALELHIKDSLSTSNLTEDNLNESIKIIGYLLKIYSFETDQNDLKNILNSLAQHIKETLSEHPLAAKRIASTLMLNHDSAPNQDNPLSKCYKLLAEHFDPTLSMIDVTKKPSFFKELPPLDESQKRLKKKITQHKRPDKKQAFSYESDQSKALQEKTYLYFIANNSYQEDAINLLEHANKKYIDPYKKDLIDFYIYLKLSDLHLEKGNETHSKHLFKKALRFLSQEERDFYYNLREANKYWGYFCDPDTQFLDDSEKTCCLRQARTTLKNLESAIEQKQSLLFSQIEKMDVNELLYIDSLHQLRRLYIDVLYSLCQVEFQLKNQEGFLRYQEKTQTHYEELNDHLKTSGSDSGDIYSVYNDPSIWGNMLKIMSNMRIEMEMERKIMNDDSPISQGNEAPII